MRDRYRHANARPLGYRAGRALVRALIAMPIVAGVLVVLIAVLGGLLLVALYFVSWFVEPVG